MKSILLFLKELEKYYYLLRKLYVLVDALFTKAHELHSFEIHFLFSSRSV
jgi:hypothetical protein